ncbi:hypothetical protein AAHA92_01604 [Salvia divinorum]|uniref:Uncharacterized protein n=1 Tax=Salvia divinorum TaxID=28513 RepID=A0ABD1IB33_SALDI
MLLYICSEILSICRRTNSTHSLDEQIQINSVYTSIERYSDPKSPTLDHKHAVSYSCCFDRSFLTQLDFVNIRASDYASGAFDLLSISHAPAILAYFSRSFQSERFGAVLSVPTSCLDRTIFCFSRGSELVLEILRILDGFWIGIRSSIQP